MDGAGSLMTLRFRFCQAITASTIRKKQVRWGGNSVSVPGAKLAGSMITVWLYLPTKPREPGNKNNHSSKGNFLVFKNKS